MASKKTPAVDFRALSAELNSILEDLENTDTDIEAALKKYERGMEIVVDMEKYLQTAENKVNKLKLQWNSSTKEA